MRLLSVSQVMSKQGLEYDHRENVDVECQANAV